MTHPLLRVSIVVLSIAAAMSGTAHADPIDPIVIREGGLNFDTGDPPIFFFLGEDVLLSGVTSIATSGALTCQISCAPGTPVDMGSVFGGAAAFGTIRGTTYEDLFLMGTFIFAAPVVVVPDAGFSVALTAPFTFNGRIAGFAGQPDGGGPVGDPLFQLNLTGRGRATMVVVRIDDLNDPYQFQSMGYQLSAPAVVPEPATLVLLSGGLAGVWVRSRRSRRSHDNP